MGTLAKRLELKGITISPQQEHPLCKILKRLITKHREFPPVEIRQKRYHPDGDERTEMYDITDGMFERSKDEMTIFNGMDATEAKGIFNSILKMVLSSMLSDQRASSNSRFVIYQAGSLRRRETYGGSDQCAQ